MWEEATATAYWIDLAPTPTYPSTRTGCASRAAHLEHLDRTADVTEGSRANPRDRPRVTHGRRDDGVHQDLAT